MSSPEAFDYEFHDRLITWQAEATRQARRRWQEDPQDSTLRDSYIREQTLLEGFQWLPLLHQPLSQWIDRHGDLPFEIDNFRRDDV